MSSYIAETSYAILMGYWNNFFGGLSPRTRIPELIGREYEPKVQPIMPASETEYPRKYNPSEREVQHGIDLVKKIISSSQNLED